MLEAVFFVFFCNCGLYKNNAPFYESPFPSFLPYATINVPAALIVIKTDEG